MPVLLYLSWFTWTLLSYSLMRLTFVLWNNPRFQGVDPLKTLEIFLFGLRFDLWTIAILSVVSLLLFLQWRVQKGWKWHLLLFALLQIPAWVMTAGDIEYVNFTGRRLVKESWVVVREGQGKVLQIVSQDLKLFLLSVLFFLVWIGGLYILSRGILKNRRFQKMENASWKTRVAVMLCFLVFLVIAGRGGLQKKPLNYAHAQIFSEPYLNLAVTNSGFTFLQSLSKKELVKHKYFSDSSHLQSQLNGRFVSDINKVPDLKGYNVVLIIVESLTTQYTGLVDMQESFTPFLDSLAGQGLSFNNHFANARRSIEGLAAILAGIPNWMEEPFINSQFASTGFVGLGSSLKEQGYQTSFFHGGENGTMYFDTFSKKAGFDQYFGANEYPNKEDHDGTWGIYDESFLQWSLTQMDQMKTPFASVIFTLSSHHPFKIPKKHEGQLKKGSLPILETIAYTDLALKEFFEMAKTKPWFEKTLFVITGDHTFKLSRPALDEEVEEFRVPLIFYARHVTWKEIPNTQLVQQMDISPSIQELLRVPQKMVNSLTASVFASGDRVVINQNDGFFWALRRQANSTELEKATYSAGKGFEGGSVELIEAFKANLQYYSDGLWDNRLYYSK